MKRSAETASVATTTTTTLESLPDDVLWSVLAEAAIEWYRFRFGRAVRYRAVCKNLRRLFDCYGYTSTTELCTFHNQHMKKSQLVRLRHLTRLTGATPYCEDAHLKLLPRLRRLKLHNSDVFFSSEVLRGLTDLRSLSLSRYDEDLDLRSLTQLTKLVLRDTHTPIAPTIFSHLTALETLSVPYGQEIVALESLTRLRELELGDVGISDAQLCQLGSLKRLTLGGHHRITDAGMRRMTNLVRLDLGFDDRLTEDAVVTLTRLRNLVISDPGPMQEDLMDALMPRWCAVDVWQHY